MAGLIYPRWEFAEDDEIEIRNSNIRIRRFAINLDVPPDLLLTEAEDLVMRAVAWLGPQQVEPLSA
jgi:hypothetical protein